MKIKSKEIVVKVLFKDKMQFMQEYGNQLSGKYPNLSIQVIEMNGLNENSPNYDDQLAALIDREKPDIYVLGYEKYRQFAEKGKLTALAAMMKQDKFDIKGFVPNLIDQLKVGESIRAFAVIYQYGAVLQQRFVRQIRRPVSNRSDELGSNDGAGKKISGYRR